MKFWMNFIFLAQKQNYQCFLNFDFTINFYIFTITFFFNMCLLFIFTNIIVFFEIIENLSKARNNLLEKVNPRWNCIVSTTTCFRYILQNIKQRKVKKRNGNNGNFRRKFLWLPYLPTKCLTNTQKKVPASIKFVKR